MTDLVPVPVSVPAFGAPRPGIAAVDRAYTLDEWRETLPSIVRGADAAWRPVPITLHLGEGNDFRTLCDTQGLRLHDEITRQLHELAHVRHASVGDEATIAALAETMVRDAGDRDAIGAWWHFPWDGRVVHLLDEDDYFAVITNRNQDKLTAEELAQLRQRRVGVVGLSVGGEAAVTVAQEHLCGEIWLADFDALDLSNLNRLGAGCDDLGVAKTTIVARRIAKLNPYLRVGTLHAGITPDNVESFVRGVDLVLEECDSLPIKGLVRRAARAYGVNVVYAADERGFVSIEPYALDPTFPPFLGDDADAHRARSDFQSAQAFYIALTAWLGGWDQISERSRQSLTKIGTSLRGYPQLASEARYAAGIVGHIARRLLLGDRLPAWHGHLDLDEQLAREPRTHTPVVTGAGGAP